MLHTPCGLRVCAGNPRRVSCAIEILSFQNFIKVLKTNSAGRKDFFDTLSPAGDRRGASSRYDLGQAAAVTVTVGPSAPPMMPKPVASAPADMLGLWLSSTAGSISVSVDESPLSVPNHPAGYSPYRS